MYLARFELDQRTLHVAAADLGARPAQPLLPPSWRGALREAGSCDFALRFAVQGGVLRSRLLLSVEGNPDPLHHLLDRLQRSTHPAEGLGFASDRGEFDRLAGAPAGQHIWLNQRGYSAGGEPVAADFRLLPLLDRVAILLEPGSSGFSYQINLRRHAPGVEDTRVVRKFLATLKVESPFPAPLTAMQSTIAGRLLQPAVLSDEILILPDPGSEAVVLGAIAEDFEATMGPFGFESPPLETGSFDHLLVTGRHSTGLGEASHFLCRGAGALAPGEIDRLLGAPPPALALGVTPGTGIPGGAPAVFLSYSSRNFLEALAICRHLEAAGIGCWMAPRDVSPGEAYPEAIMRGIEACRVLVLLLSDASNLSPHVHREIERALSRNAVVIPLRLLDITPTGAMAYLISTCQWIDAFGPAFDSALAGLLARLRSLLGGAAGARDG